MYIYTRTRTQLLTELVLLRFQQSGLSRFCSSARALASMVYILLSSFFIFFHLSPRMTLMALEQVNSAEIKIQTVPYFGKKQKKQGNVLYMDICTHTSGKEENVILDSCCCVWSLQRQQLLCKAVACPTLTLLMQDLELGFGFRLG